MHAARRLPIPETHLKALYRSRESVVSLIRALERYQRAPVRATQGWSRHAPRTAA
jgi:hypothetical protein